MKCKILIVSGTRPNIIKAAPLLIALRGNSRFEVVFLHSGQHYDHELFQIFKQEFGLSDPDIEFDAPNDQTLSPFGNLLCQFESTITTVRPDFVIVFGDVDTTLAAALASRKNKTSLIHIEAGLRSFDKAMPEEINRILTDSLSDFLLTTGDIANKNLLREGFAENKIIPVGNIMIDTLLKMREKIQQSSVLTRLGLTAKEYIILTLHRPSNVDKKASLEAILSLIPKISADYPFVFPVHPRTRNRLLAYGLWEELQALDGVILTEPLGYLDFGKLISNARLVLTDSGGVQEETTVYGVPCLTLRNTTERPETVSLGTSCLAGTDHHRIIQLSARALSGDWPQGSIPPLWDGKTAERIVQWMETL